MAAYGIGPLTSKILILLDSPQAAAFRHGSFLNQWVAGQLDSCLLKAGIHQAETRIELLGSPDSLTERLNQTMPELRIILALGQKSLAALTGKVSLEKWHTSPLVPRDPELRCRKIIATFPPFRIEAQPELMVFWQRTFARAREECATKEFVPIPERFLINPPYEQTMDTLSDIRKYEWLSVDIETGRGQINTTGFAWSPYDAIAINTLDKRLSEDKFHKLWLSIAELLEGPQKKILQNNIFEHQMFSHYGIRMQGVAHDTMWAQKFLWPEFKMGLDNVARFYTNRPYWKDDGKVSVDGEANRKSWDNVRDWERHYIYNCLSKDMQIYTDQGLIPIGQITRNKIKCNVYSWNEKSNKFEWKPITNWLVKRERFNIHWVIVKTEGMAGKKGLHTTADHKVLTDRGWLRADSIKVGDYMLTEKLVHDAGTIYGTILGDSSLQNTSDKSVAYLTVTQVNEELINLKKSLFGGTINKAYRTTGYKSNYFWDLYVPACPQLARLKTHKNIKLCLPQLTPMGIALWFMDDGCLQKSKYSSYMKLALQSFTREEREITLDFFRARYEEKTGCLDAAGNLILSTKISRKLCAELGQYFVPSMRYKMSHEGPPYSLEACLQFKSVIRPANVRVLNVKREFKQKRGYKTSHCISVKDNANFLTEFGVVANCRDTTGTFEAAFAQRRDLSLRKIYKAYETLVARLAEPIHEMCSNGLLVNEAKRIQLRDQTEKEIEELTKQLPEGFNPRSPKQKLELLKSRGYKIPKIRVKGKYQESTNELSIKKLRLTHPEDKDLAVLLSLAKKQKALSSYINFEYDRDGKMRYSLKGIGTETGRMAAGTDCFGKGINPQTMPKKYKCIYDAPPGYRFLNIDLKQAESRYVAYACADYDLITMLEDPTKDIHKYVAAEIFQKPESEITFDERQLGKKSGHGANYDMGPATFAESCLKEMDKVLSLKEAKNVLDSYHRLFPGIRRGHSDIRDKVRTTKKLANPLGRERYFYGRLDQNTFREAYAFCPQSTIPDITNQLMFSLLEQRASSHINFKLLLQVHDSLLLLVRPEDEEGVCTFASRTELWHPEIHLPGGQLIIPVDFESGTNLGETE